MQVRWRISPPADSSMTWHFEQSPSSSSTSMWVMWLKEGTQIVAGRGVAMALA